MKGQSNCGVCSLGGGVRTEARGSSGQRVSSTGNLAEDGVVCVKGIPEPQVDTSNRANRKLLLHTTKTLYLKRARVSTVFRHSSTIKLSVLVSCQADQNGDLR